MASQNINVGADANDGNGESLRSAFIDIRKMFAEVYGQTYTSDTQDLGGTTLAFKADQLSLTNTAEAATDNYVITYDDASGGFTLEEKFDGDITSVVAGDGLIGGASDGDATLNVNVDDSTIEIDADTVRLKDDGVTHAKLEGRYTDVDVISSTTSPITLDASSFSGFDLTGNLGTVTLEIQGIKKGQVIDILLSGADLSSAAITLDDNFTSSTINKVGTTSIDTTAKNIIQVLCIDDDTNAAELNWAVASYAAGATV